MTIFDLMPIVVAFNAGIIVAVLAIAIGQERRKAQAPNLSLALRPANDVGFFD